MFWRCWLDDKIIHKNLHQLWSSCSSAEPRLTWRDPLERTGQTMFSFAHHFGQQWMQKFTGQSALVLHLTALTSRHLPSASAHSCCNIQTQTHPTSHNSAQDASLTTTLCVWCRVQRSLRISQLITTIQYSVTQSTQQTNAATAATSNTTTTSFYYVPIFAGKPPVQFGQGWVPQEITLRRV